MKKQDKKVQGIKFECCNFVMNAKELQFTDVKRFNEKGQEVKIKYFTCPNCGKKYIVSVVDRKIKTFNIRISDEIEKVSKNNSQKKNAEVLKSANELMASQKEYENLLKSKFKDILN